MTKNDDNLKILAFTLKVLTLHKCWPKNGKTVNFLFYIKLLFHFLLACGFWCLPLLRLIKVFQGHIHADVSEDIALLSSSIGIQWSSLSYITKQKQLSNLYDHLEDTKEFGLPDNCNKKNKTLIFLSKCYYAYCFCGCVIYATISHLTKTKICEKIRIETNFNNEVCGLMVSAWFPINVNYFPMYQIVFGWTLLSGIYLCCLGSTISFTTYEVASHISIRINHLKRLLIECFDTDSYKLRRERLNFCIRYHIDIILISQKFNAGYKRCMGVYLIMTACIFGAISNQIVTQQDVACMIHLAGWVLALLLVCIAGQLLISKSTEIADAAYGSKWYNAELDLQKDIAMMIIRAQKPLQLKAGMFGILSYPLFASIVKTSYSYLTLLNEQ